MWGHFEQPDNRTDEELMTLLTQGEQSAFDSLYQRYSRPLFHFFYRLLDYNRDKAEDFLHDLFLKIIENQCAFDNKQSFKTWLYTIAGNMIKNEYRNKTVRQAYTDAQFESPEDYTTEQQHNLDKQLFEKKYREALLNMQPEDRLLIQLRFHEAFSIKQLAVTLNIPEGTVKSRLHYLTRQLSQKLAPYSYQ